MMAKDPAERYPTPIDVAEALAEWADMPVTPPPAREMPMHCPLVQALAGPPAPISGAPLARVLFGPGRAVFPRPGTGPSSASAVRSSSTSSPSTVSFGTSTGSNPSYPIGDEAAGPVSTGRASATPTAPLPPRKSPFPPPVRRQPTGDNGGTQHSRTTLYIIIAILLGLLFAVGAIAAYYVGRADAGRTGWWSAPVLPERDPGDQSVWEARTSSSSP
jgi:hypothetical protein